MLAENRLGAVAALFRRRPGFAAALAALLVLIGAPAAAQSFEELEARLAAHPSVTSLRAEREAREQLARAARGLPDPVVSFGVNNLPLSDPGFDRLMMTNKAIGVRQQIPNRRETRARAEQERGAARAADLKADWLLSRLRAELVAALAEKGRAAEQLAIARRQAEKYDALEAILRGELDAGRPAFARLSQIDVERADIDRRIAALEGERGRIDAALVDLVGEAADVSPPAEELRIWDGDVGAFYAARLAEAGVNIAEAGVRECKAAFGPDFGVQLTYQQRESGVDPLGDPFNGDDWFSAGVTLTVPLWAASSQKPRLAAARARESAARLDYHAAVRAAEEEWRARLALYLAAQRGLAALEEKIAAVDERIAAMKRAYEAGRGDYALILDAEIGRLTLLSQRAAERAAIRRLAAEANSLLVMP
ncbi:TolC family protein [Amphiplicatus metriothermophilus]|uniref:Outer membrane protein TolC n=1 Tax=Amphiplicatus metriothermophilus TaxID=1519374 RepID=A0A239PPW2_9PROT|nr:TolC family protein [Amphiplicatus metriothermophilus]MBB5518901.1 outer membrane protein TolC [Amphiplicatus metriothermophilus]SNT71946.1 Outer membrane protein TolC [Amphiplicatus metriothermophilus]